MLKQAFDLFDIVSALLSTITNIGWGRTHLKEGTAESASCCFYDHRFPMGRLDQGVRLRQKWIDRVCRVQGAHGESKQGR